MQVVGHFYKIPVLYPSKVNIMKDKVQGDVDNLFQHEVLDWILEPKNDT